MARRRGRSPQDEQRQVGYLDEKQAASYLALSVSFLQKSRVTGSLPGRPCPPFIKIGRAVRYSPADLDAFMAQHRVRR